MVAMTMQNKHKIVLQQCALHIVRITKNLIGLSNISFEGSDRNQIVVKYRHVVPPDRLSTLALPRDAGRLGTALGLGRVAPDWCNES
jgi:hypothetical protein